MGGRRCTEGLVHSSGTALRLLGDHRRDPALTLSGGRSGAVCDCSQLPRCFRAVFGVCAQLPAEYPPRIIGVSHCPRDVAGNGSTPPRGWALAVSMRKAFLISSGSPLLMSHLDTRVSERALRVSAGTKPRPHGQTQRSPGKSVIFRGFRLCEEGDLNPTPGVSFS
jgi:hypothetical protein